MEDDGSIGEKLALRLMWHHFGRVDNKIAKTECYEQDRYSVVIQRRLERPGTATFA